MSFSPSRNKPLDVGDFGYDAERLPSLEAGPIDFGSWFDKPDQPLELEIGSGKGTFLVQQASQNPQINYIGLEYAKAFWRHAADRVRRHNLTNVRMVHYEAGTFVRNYVADKTLRQVHIYFPDPWPKARHNKRRLIQAPFLEQVHKLLVDPREDDPEAGQIRIATDHSDYFEWMLEHAGKVTHLFEQRAFDRPDSAGEGELVGTNFERKYRREGRPFHSFILRKIP